MLLSCLHTRSRIWMLKKVYTWFIGRGGVNCLTAPKTSVLSRVGWTTQCGSFSANAGPRGQMTGRRLKSLSDGLVHLFHLVQRLNNSIALHCICCISSILMICTALNCNTNKCNAVHPDEDARRICKKSLSR